MTTDSRTLRPIPTTSRRLKPRHLWIVPALAIAVYANLLAGEHGVSILALLAFGIVPHLPALLGVGQPHARGQMPRRAVPLFNAMHHPVPPLVVLGLAAIDVLSPFWFVGALVWFSHIVADLALDQGLRTADGWSRPWGASR